MRKQLIATVVMFSLSVVMLIAYFVAIKPFTTIVPVETGGLETVVAEDGEGLGMAATKVVVYDGLENKDVVSIKVENEFGTYEMTRDEDWEPQIAGFEGLAVHEENITSLMSSCTYPLAITRVNAVEGEDYGFEETVLEDGSVHKPAKFTMKTRHLTDDGSYEYRIYECLIGYKIATGNGYYFKYLGRSNSVYVVDTSIETTLLSTVESIVFPMVITPMNQNDYFMVHDFVLMKGEDMIFHLDYVEQADREGTEYETATYEMIYPAGLTPSATAISKAMYALYTAETEDHMKVVALGITDEKLAQYNMDSENCYSMRFTYNGFDNFIVISPPNDDGSCYVASSMFDQINLIDSEVMFFIQWDLFDWVETPMFQMKIDYVESVSVRSGNYSATFDLNGDGQDLVVTDRATGKALSTPQFRNYYWNMLVTSYEGNCSLTKEEMESYKALDDSEAQLVLTVKTESGRELTYRFYQYSERRSYVTLNGVGEFFVLRTMPDKLVADAKLLQEGKEIFASGK